MQRQFEITSQEMANGEIVGEPRQVRLPDPGLAMTGHSRLQELGSLGEEFVGPRKIARRSVGASQSSKRADANAITAQHARKFLQHIPRTAVMSESCVRLGQAQINVAANTRGKGHEGIAIHMICRSEVLRRGITPLECLLRLAAAQSDGGEEYLRANKPSNELAATLQGQCAVDELLGFRILSSLEGQAS